MIFLMKEPSDELLGNFELYRIIRLLTCTSSPTSTTSRINLMQINGIVSKQPLEYHPRRSYLHFPLYSLEYPLMYLS